jgi:hypothetical protein
VLIQDWPALDTLLEGDRHQQMQLDYLMWREWEHVYNWRAHSFSLQTQRKYVKCMHAMRQHIKFTVDTEGPYNLTADQVIEYFTKMKHPAAYCDVFCAALKQFHGAIKRQLDFLCQVVAFDHSEISRFMFGLRPNRQVVTAFEPLLPLEPNRPLRFDV